MTTKRLKSNREKISSHVPLQFLLLFVGEPKPLKHEQLREDGFNQFPVHQVLTPHVVLHTLAAQTRTLRMGEEEKKKATSEPKNA